MFEQIRNRELPPELLEKRRNRIHHHSWDYACSPERSPIPSPRPHRELKDRFSPVTSPRRRSPLSFSTPSMPITSVDKISYFPNDNSATTSSGLSSINTTTQLPEPIYSPSARSTSSQKEQNNPLSPSETRVRKFMGESEPTAMTNWRETTIVNESPNNRSPLCLLSMQDLIVVQKMAGSMISMPLILLIKRNKGGYHRNNFAREIIDIQVNNKDIDLVIVVNTQQEASIFTKEQAKVFENDKNATTETHESMFNQQDPSNEEKLPVKRNSVEQEPFELFYVTIPVTFMNQWKLYSGQNRVRLRNRTSGHIVDGEVYLWRYDAKLVILDIDGTIQRNNGSDGSYPRKGWRAEHEHLAEILQHCNHNGYKIVYKTCTRDLKISYQTKLFMNLLRFPSGPIFLSTGFSEPSMTEPSQELQDITQLQVLQKLYCDAAEISLENLRNPPPKPGGGITKSTSVGSASTSSSNHKWSLGNIFSSKKKKSVSETDLYSESDQPYSAVFCHVDDVNIYSSLDIPVHRIYALQDKKKVVVGGKSLKSWADAKKKLEATFPRTEESFLKPSRSLSPTR